MQQLPPLPLKEHKTDQQNFKEHAEAKAWLHRNGYKSSGMLTEEPYAIFFVERFDKLGFVALYMNATYVKQDNLNLWDKPYQIDIATT